MVKTSAWFQMQLTMFLFSMVVDCQRFKQQQLAETFLVLPMFEVLIISDDFEGLNVQFCSRHLEV